MAVVNAIDRVTDWARTNICEKVRLKMPPADDRDATDKGYAYQPVTPAAFSMYVPTKEKLPPTIQSPFPSLCVRFMEGADNLSGSEGSIGLQLCFSAWDPGVHGEDVFLPDSENKGTFRRWTGAEAEAYFQRSGNGWRDAWNFVDVALREIESVTSIDGFVIDRSVPVKFGPLAEQEAISDYYPFWFAWVSFTLTYPLARNTQGIQNLL